VSSNRRYRFETLAIHAGQESARWEGATRAPIVQSASHAHESAESLSRCFAGESEDHVYMRLSNPTNRVLEEKLRVLEGAAGALVVSSGMAAVSNVCLALLRTGDELVSGRSLFMSTSALFTRVLPKYGMTACMADSTDIRALERGITDRTRFVYLEVIGNPRLDIPDIAEASAMAHAHGLPLVVDATLATPWLFRPLEHGADVVVHSTTKYLNGHGSALGGAILDGGRFDFSGPRFPDFEPFVQRKGRLALLGRIWSEGHINLGTTQAPMHSYLTMLGLDTLALRMERHMANALKVARFLKGHSKVHWVNYPGLDDHPGHETAIKQFAGKGFGALLTFGLASAGACRDLIDNLRLISNLANLGDAKTLILHPRSTQYITHDDDACALAGVGAEMLRLSVGIENADDICEDLEQALGKI
jgi:O-acetylhomoserine (thiol)-lyase